MKIWIPALLLLAGAGIWFLKGKGAGRLVNDPPPAGAIVAFGDSLTSGFGAGKGESYPEDLAKLIGRPVINAGVAGDTVEGAALRLDRDVLSHKPGLVIVLLGGNDYLHGGDLAPTFAALEEIVLKIQKSGALVVLAGLESPIPFGGIGGKFRALAKKTGALFVPDALGGILGEPRLMSDQVHPNAAGYKIMAGKFEQAIRGHLPAGSKSGA